MMETAPLTIRLNAADNVVVARAKIAAGTDIPGEGVTAGVEIPAGHKIATRTIGAGDPVRKYNQVIGFASGDIAAGEPSKSEALGLGDNEFVPWVIGALMHNLAARKLI
jgi:altronate hydrolase